jgi:hypothetical protein
VPVQIGDKLHCYGTNSDPRGWNVDRRSHYFLVMKDGSHRELAAVLSVAVEFWRMELADKNLPSPFI